MAKTTRTKKGKKAAAPEKKGAKNAAAAPANKKAAKGKAGKPGKGGGLRARAQRAQKGKASKPAKTAAGRERGGAGKFLREVKVELTKVTWPNREELTQSTIVVFIAIAIAALYIAFFDVVFTRLVELIS